jgi:hypothetical protein
LIEYDSDWSEIREIVESSDEEGSSQSEEDSFEGFVNIRLGSNPEREQRKRFKRFLRKVLDSFGNLACLFIRRALSQETGLLEDPLFKQHIQFDLNVSRYIVVSSTNKFINDLLHLLKEAIETIKKFHSNELLFNTTKKRSEKSEQKDNKIRVREAY